MRHLTLPRFWRHYRQLSSEVQELADKNFELLKSDPYHASLHFKRSRQEQAALVGARSHYRALGADKPTEFYGFGIGTHSTCDKLLS